MSSAFRSNGRRRLGLVELPSQIEDAVYDPDAPPFPMVDIGLGMMFQWIWVTAEIAKEFLARRHEHQRSIKKIHLNSMMADSLAGRFDKTTQPGAFSRSEKLIDAQHRLQMVVSTLRPLLMPFMFGIPDEYYKNYDLTAKRSTADTLRSLDVKNAHTVSAVCNLAHAYAEWDRKSSVYPPSVQVTPSLLKEILDENPEIEISTSKTRAIAKKFGNPTVFAFCHMLMSIKDAELADEFFSLLLSPANCGERSAILKLRSRIEDPPMRRKDKWVVFSMISKGWNCWLDGWEGRYMADPNGFVEPLSPRGRRA